MWRQAWALLLAVEGKSDEAEGAMDPETLKWSEAAFVGTSVTADFYAGLGDAPKAIEWVRKAVRNGDERVDWYRRNPRFSTLQKDPAFCGLSTRLRRAARETNWSIQMGGTHMNCRMLGLAAIAVFSLAAPLKLAQGPAPEAPPSLEQMRQSVSRLRGNRIATPTNYDNLTTQQKKYVESILSGPRSDISGPLGVMMVTPELGDLVQKAVAYSRFAGREGFSSVPPKLNELAILVVAKRWSAEYVWNAHHTAAVRLGIPAEVVEAIRTGKRPASMERDVEAIYNFASEFMAKGEVSDATLAAAKKVLGGDRGVVDLVGTMGLYQISSMMVSLDQTPLAAGTKPYLH